MRQLNWKFPTHVGIALAFALFVPQAAVVGQETADQESRKTVEPVFRISKLTTVNDAQPVNKNDVDKKNATKDVAKANAKAAATGVATADQPHALDRALEIAHNGLAHMKENVTDYTAMLAKRERINGKLSDTSYMNIKVRNERKTASGQVPLSIYMKFLKPRDKSGREVIWVKGANNDKLAAHEGGRLNFKTFWLDPTGWLAMNGQRYPIYDAGLENLVHKLIEKAERDRAAGPCEVQYISEGKNINKRPCLMIEVRHPIRKAPYEFYKAQVYIDDELQIPVRYAAYDWPSSPGQKAPLIEEYTYVQVKLNVGLDESDFDVSNPVYKFPK